MAKYAIETGKKIKKDNQKECFCVDSSYNVCYVF
jgi:hypothetical protein